MKAAVLRAVDANRKPMAGAEPSLGQIAAHLIEMETAQLRELRELRGVVDQIRRAVGLDEFAVPDDVAYMVEQLMAGKVRS